MNQNNPFLDHYAKKEIAEYGVFKYESGPVRVKSNALIGQVNDYLNVNFRIDEEMVAPSMIIKGEIWMSITPLEIQSHYLPIRRATGDVAIAGLGMGYCTLSIMKKDDVKKVDVYESQPEVIEFFKEKFHDRPGYDKVTIIPGDARENLVGKPYDFAYIDIYPSILSDELISDRVFFAEENDIDTIHMWGEELVVYEKFMQNKRFPLLPDETEFFMLFLKSPGSKLRGYYNGGSNYLNNFLEAAGRL